MKFVRFENDEHEGAPRVGILDGDEIVSMESLSWPGTGIDDMSSFLEHLKSNPEFKQQVADLIKGGKFRCSESSVKKLAPINNSRAIFCVGMNYKDHCIEQNYPIPKEPIIFNKLGRCVVNPGDIIKTNGRTDELDFEVELAIVIGKQAKNISETMAPEYIAGYTVAHDVSARDWQIKRNGGQWFIGKTFDTFAPIGPCIVSGDSIDPNNLEISCTLNGEQVQKGNTSEFIFRPAPIVAWLSSFVTLYPGDLIFTGTPCGVGCFRKPQLWLKDGDVVTCTIEGIGSITNAVSTAPESKVEPEGLLSLL